MATGGIILVIIKNGVTILDNCSSECINRKGRGHFVRGVGEEGWIAVE
jgi:hypothetical protein